MRKLIKSKKIFAVVLALTMVFSMTSAVFADTTLNSTVWFTYYGYELWTEDPVTTPMGNTVSQKPYFTSTQAASSTINPLGNQTSIMDTILEAAANLNEDVITGVDLNPMYGDPGAYISQVGDLEPWNQYWVDFNDETDTWIAHSIGEGWTAYVSSDGGSETEPTTYLSRISLQDDDAIRFDFSYYEYEWETTTPDAIQ